MHLSTHSVVNLRVYVQTQHDIFPWGRCHWCQSSHGTLDVYWQFWSQGVSMSMNMSKLSWRIWYLEKLGFFLHHSTKTPINQSACTFCFGTFWLRSGFPAKSSTDGPRHWHCKRTIYAMHMMPSNSQFAVQFYHQGDYHYRLYSQHQFYMPGSVLTSHRGTLVGRVPIRLDEWDVYWEVLDGDTTILLFPLTRKSVVTSILYLLANCSLAVVQ